MIEGFLSRMDEFIIRAPYLAFAAAYLAGFAVSLTPCVYPLFPVTFAYIGGSTVGNRHKTLLLSLSYVFGLAVCYASLGLAASMTGQLFGKISTHPATMFIVANLYLLLGLSMLDVISIRGVFFSKDGAKTRPAGPLGAFFVGIGSALAVGPCTAPVLGSILLFVAKKGNLLYGSGLLFVFALGVGTILILIGIMAGTVASLPKAGPWMNGIKKAFGWAMILIAEYFLIELGIRVV